MRKVCHFNKDLIDYVAIYEDEKLVHEAYFDYDENGKSIKITSTKDIWYDYYHEDNYYEISRIFDRNRRY